MQGPRLEYIDIVTDTLHASSSDLITWNTLVMMKLRWINEIPREWIDITTNSLETWSARDQLSPFHADNRRGYARVTPVALSNVGIPGSHAHPVDEYPTNGLGIYDDYETSDDFNGYVWATWTTMEAQRYIRTVSWIAGRVLFHWTNGVSVLLACNKAYFRSAQ